MPKKLDIPQENELTPEEITPPQETLTKPKSKRQESSSSSSSDDEDEKVVYVKKIKDKSKKQIHHKQENNDREYRQNESLDSTLYKSSQEILHKRAIEERVRANLIRWNNAMMPQEY